MHIWQAKDKEFKLNLGISKYFLLIGAGIIKLQCSPSNKQGSKQGGQETIRRPEDPNDDTESLYITYPCTKYLLHITASDCLQYFRIIYIVPYTCLMLQLTIIWIVD